MEYMDSKRFYSSKAINRFYEGLSEKLEKLPEYDVIITADDNALKLALTYHDSLFPNTPVVFCGVNNEKLARSLQDNNWFTGVMESVSIFETVDLIRRLRPQTETIFAISDSTPTGTLDLDRLKRVMKSFPGINLQPLSLTHLSWEQLFHKLRILPENDSILLLSAFRDSNFSRKSFEENLELISNNTKLPIFHLWEHGLGEGILGGKLISHYEQGRIAAEMALEIMEGTSVGEVGLMEGGKANRFMFDRLQLDRHGIPMDDLPEKSIVINNNPGFFETHIPLILGTISGFSLLLLLVAVLTAYSLKLRKARDEIRSGEAILQALFRNAAAGIVMTTREGQIMKANSAFSNPLGSTEDELSGTHISRLTHPEDLTSDEQRLRELLDGKRQTLSLSKRFLKKDNSILWGDFSLALFNDPVRDENLIVGVFEDVTELHLSHSKLRESELRLKTTLERLNSHISNSPLAVIEWDNMGRIVSWSGMAEKTFGWASEEVLGKSWSDWEFIYKDDYEKVEREISRLVKGEQAFNTIANRNLTKNGEIVSCRWHNSALLDEDENLISILSQVENVTAEVKAQKDLEKSEIRLRSMFENMGSGVAIYEAVDKGHDFIFKDFNPMAEQITNTTREEVLGQRLSSRFPNMEESPLFKALQEVWRTGKSIHLPPFHYEDHVRSGWCENRIYRLPSGEVVAIFDDVTRRMETQQDLIEAKEAAESASRAKTDFLANMSHEIRTPLNGISGMVQLMLMTPLNEEQKEYANTAIESARRLSLLLGDILDISKIESGRLEIARRQFNPHEVFESLRNLFTPPANQAGLEIAFKIDPNIPKSLIGDQNRLHQILNNLVGNSIKFTERGNIDVEASMLPTDLKNSCRILFSVSDTGIGIPDSKINEVFSPFRQAEESLTRNYEGVGLGLAIVKKIITLMGGNISVSSSPDTGTSIYFSLSFELTPGYSCTEEPTNDLEEQDFAPLKILLVEDEEVNLRTIQIMLEKTGCNTVSARNGNEALEILEKEKVDLILMDVQMPIMNGMEASKAIREGQCGEENRDVPIIALTAYAMKGDRDKFLASGMNDYLSKPLDFTLLKTVLSKYTH